ncbi:glutamine synthetase [Rhodosalinus halophilus]|uniref:Glutamine synthetase n=1 Tax=Rhodosalinus halophilus TaxID=2259333 RepID=A0A365U5I2_9RHOB|nr:glutamine synthetase family protein [Rhodosalinus halophilus]RBI83652.1 glutamine synthetase [Rhodosalinus halophilus]
MTEHSERQRFATIAVVDTNGLLRGQKVAARALPGLMEHGMGMAPAQLALDPTDEILELPGVTDETGDFHDSPLRIDPESLRHMPWEAPGDAALYLADFTGDAEAFCPRAVLRRVLARAAEMGIRPRFGFEVEFTLFEETHQSLTAKGYDGLTTATPHASHDLIIYQSLQSEFYGALADICEGLRVDLAKLHEEIGGGFMEACIGAGTGLEPADQCVLLKNFLRVLAMRRGQSACFMPRWSEEADSQSMHIHVSLADMNGTPLFWEAEAEHRMSERFRHFIGGLQAHMGDMMLVFAPTVNAYRRFAEGTFAPPALTWGPENRTTAFRVVGHGPSALRVENRLPGSDANPHFVAAATLAAGLAGIRDRIEPHAATRGNGYVPGTGHGPDFPRDMDEAIARLRASDCAAEWLGPRFVEAFSATRASQRAQLAGATLIDERRRFFELG